jgi:hypothetical protein
MIHNQNHIKTGWGVLGSMYSIYVPRPVLLEKCIHALSPAPYRARFFSELHLQCRCVLDFKKACTVETTPFITDIVLYAPSVES